MKNILFLLLFLFSTANADQHNISIKKFKFSPAEITIIAGDSIRWTNEEKRQYHNVWFEKLGEPEPDYLFPGDFFDKTFSEIGDFPYRCGPHPKMTGIVHVIKTKADEDAEKKPKLEIEPDKKTTELHDE